MQKGHWIIVGTVGPLSVIGILIFIFGWCVVTICETQIEIISFKTPQVVSQGQIIEADFVIVNTGSSIRTVNIYILQPTEVIANERKILVNKRLGAGETYLSLEMIGQSIGTNGSIQGVVDAGTDTTVSIVGTEFST